MQEINIQRPLAIKGKDLGALIIILFSCLF